MKKLKINEWNDLREKCFSMTKTYPHLRIGQCLFNILHEQNPELANFVRGTINDPFYASVYTDTRVRKFYDTVVDIDGE